MRAWNKNIDCHNKAEPMQNGINNRLVYVCECTNTVRQKDIFFSFGLLNVRQSCFLYITFWRKTSINVYNSRSEIVVQYGRKISKGGVEHSRTHLEMDIHSNIFVINEWNEKIFFSIFLKKKTIVLFMLFFFKSLASVKFVCTDFCLFTNQSWYWQKKKE